MAKRKKGTLPTFTPVPRLTQRSNGWSDEVQRQFIEALADTGSVTSAARAVNRTTVGAYLLRRHPEGESFRKAWQVALDLGVQRIEDVAMDRALNGTEVPVYSYGQMVGTRTVYNDRLLMFMLRNRAPKRFTEGRARALNAVDQHTLERHKKQWRKEWEEEQQKGRVSPAEVRASLERKIAAMRRAVVARTSPAAYELEIARSAQSRADSAAGWRPGQPYEPFRAAAATHLPRFIEEVRQEWPSYEKAHPAPTAEELAEWEESDDDEDEETEGEVLALPGPG